MNTQNLFTCLIDLHQQYSVVDDLITIEFSKYKNNTLLDVDKLVLQTKLNYYNDQIKKYLSTIYEYNIISELLDTIVNNAIKYKYKGKQFIDYLYTCHTRLPDKIINDIIHIYYLRKKITIINNLFNSNINYNLENHIEF